MTLRITPWTAGWIDPDPLFVGAGGMTPQGDSDDETAGCDGIEGALEGAVDDREEDESGGAVREGDDVADGVTAPTAAEQVVARDRAGEDVVWEGALGEDADAGVWEAVARDG